MCSACYWVRCVAGPRGVRARARGGLHPWVWACVLWEVLTPGRGLAWGVCACRARLCRARRGGRLWQPGDPALQPAPWLLRGCCCLSVAHRCAEPILLGRCSRLCAQSLAPVLSVSRSTPSKAGWAPPLSVGKPGRWLIRFSSETGGLIHAGVLSNRRQCLVYLTCGKQFNFSSIKG